MLVGVTGCVTLTLHGALWVAFKTNSLLAERARRMARALWPVVATLALCTTWASAAVQPQLARNLSLYPVGLFFAALALAALVGVRVWLLKNARAAFVASCSFVFAEVLSAAFAIFPHALASRVPGRELSLEAAAARPETLRLMLWWWIPGMLLAAGYSYFTYSRLPKAFSSTDGSSH